MNDNLKDIEDLSTLIELYCKNNGVIVKTPIEFGIVDNGLGQVTIKNWAVQGLQEPTKKDLEDLSKNSKDSIIKLKKNQNMRRVVLPIVVSVSEIENPEEGSLVLEDSGLGLDLKVFRNNVWNLI